MKSLIIEFLTASSIKLLSFPIFCYNIRTPQSFYRFLSLCSVFFVLYIDIKSSYRSDDSRFTCLNQHKQRNATLPSIALTCNFLFVCEFTTRKSLLSFPQTTNSEAPYEFFIFCVRFTLSQNNQPPIGAHNNGTETSGSGCSGRKGFDHSYVFLQFEKLQKNNKHCLQRLC